MNEKLMRLFACYMIEILTAKGVIGVATSQEIFDSMVELLCKDFKQYCQKRGVSLDSVFASEPEPPRKVIIMCRGSELSN